MKLINERELFRVNLELDRVPASWSFGIGKLALVLDLLDLRLETRTRTQA